MHCTSRGRRLVTVRRDYFEILANYEEINSIEYWKLNESVKFVFFRCQGIPLHIQIDTYDESSSETPICRAYCKIKVFCDKVYSHAHTTQSPVSVLYSSFWNRSEKTAVDKVVFTIETSMVAKYEQFAIVVSKPIWLIVTAKFSLAMPTSHAGAGCVRSNDVLLGL